VLAKNAINPYDYGSLEDKVVTDYIATHSPVSAQLEGRITRDDTATPADLPATGSDGSTFAPLALMLLGAAFALITTGTLIRWRTEQSGK
jgi:hypothetical protein